VTEVRDLRGTAGFHTPTLDEVVARAADVGLRRIQMLAWRDLDDPEAGGSERHAHHVASQWADAGLDVVVRTSVVRGCPPTAQRDGYRVLRKGMRHSVFPRSALSGLVGRRGRPDGLVEIWNGMPFFSPVWARCPRVVFLHHVHAEMWQMVLRPWHAQVGEFIERRLAPPLYRTTRIVTLSESSRHEIVAMLKLRPSRVSVVPPGVDPRFSPGGRRAAQPLVVAVGRLVPVKRFDLLMRALADVRRRVPDLHAVIVGEGYERPRLEAERRALGAESWLELAGHKDDDELLDLYRQAWVLASTSQREGWGMTVSEAAGCGTPAVVSRIAGHVDAVEHGVSGFVANVPSGRARPGAPASTAAWADALEAVLVDRDLRERLGRGARRHAEELTWEATAAGTLGALVDEAIAGNRPAP